MVRFNLLKLIKKLERFSGRKIPMREVAAKSGCDASTLSRLINHPDIVPSANVIDRLVQYFFFATKDFTDRDHEKSLMDDVIGEFITVYPDRPDYWSILPREVQDEPNSTTLDTIWSMYESLKYPDRKERLSLDKPSKKTLIDVIQKIFHLSLQADIDEPRKEQYQLILSSGELDLLKRLLPEIREQGNIEYHNKINEQDKVQGDTKPNTRKKPPKSSRK